MLPAPGIECVKRVSERKKERERETKRGREGERERGREGERGRERRERETDRKCVMVLSIECFSKHLNLKHKLLIHGWTTLPFSKHNQLLNLIAASIHDEYDFGVSWDGNMTDVYT